MNEEQVTEQQEAPSPEVRTPEQPTSPAPSFSTADQDAWALGRAVQLGAINTAPQAPAVPTIPGTSIPIPTDWEEMNATDQVEYVAQQSETARKSEIEALKAELRREQAQANAPIYESQAKAVISEGLEPDAHAYIAEAIRRATGGNPALLPMAMGPNKSEVQDIARGMWVKDMIAKGQTPQFGERRPVHMTTTIADDPGQIRDWLKSTFKIQSNLSDEKVAEWMRDPEIASAWRNR